MNDLERQAESAGVLVGVTPESSQRLILAGVHLFSEIGFHATTTRDLAQRAGLSPAALYIHYPSKGSLLGAILVSSHQRVIDQLEAALVDAGKGPVERFHALARAFALWHAEHIEVARIGIHDLGAVPDEQFGKVREKRARIVELFETELRQGIEAGVLEAKDIHHVVLAVLSLGLDLTRWYSRERSKSADEIADLYGELAVRMVVGRDAVLSEAAVAVRSAVRRTP
jgi:AcrR family transcriptional regulator